MFKKKGIDILDIPELNRKKLIKLPEVENKEEVKITKDGYFDLSKANAAPQAIQPAQVQPVSQETNQMGSFFSDFAALGASQPQITPKEDNTDIKDLKWRLENLEFKLEQLIEKVNSINK